MRSSAGCRIITVAVLMLLVFFPLAIGLTNVDASQGRYTRTSSTTSSTTTSSTSAAAPPNYDEPFVYTYVASTSSPNQAYAVVAGRIAQRNVSGALKTYLYVFINTKDTFSINESNIVSQTSIQASSTTTNLYWNAESPPASWSPSGNGLDYGIVGGDIAQYSNGQMMLSQYVDSTYQFTISTKSSATAGPMHETPPSCTIDSGGQERDSIYVLVLDNSSGSSYVMSGEEALERVASVTSVEYDLIIFVNAAKPMSVSYYGLDKDCGKQPFVPSSGFYWVARAPPSSNTVAGNYEIYATVGGSLATASSTNALVYEQFMDKNYQFV